MNNKIKIDAIKHARSLAANSLYHTLQTLLNSGQLFSEVEFRDNWLKEMRKDDAIFPDGWYSPPPHGMAVLFGTSQKRSRINYENLRAEPVWPHKNIYFNKQNPMIYCFASPVDRKTGLFGDFGMNIYIGNDSKVQKHLRRCLKLTKIIIEYIQLHMTFMEFASYANNLFLKSGLQNEIVSITDPARVNLGHTIPGSYENWTKDELKILKTGISTQIADLISKKRKFINTNETQKFLPGMGVSIEPRLTQSDQNNLPMASFHTIVYFDTDGKKEVITCFEEIFKLTKMSYMFN